MTADGDDRCGGAGMNRKADGKRCQTAVGARDRCLGGVRARRKTGFTSYPEIFGRGGN